MRNTVFLLIFFITTSFLSAQSISEPLRQNRNVLVSSAGLPEEYLLFAPDTATQILFNPARGANYNGNFVYINYYSDNTTYPVYLTAMELNTTITPVYETGLSKATGSNISDIYSFPSISETHYSSSSNPSFSIASLINCGTAKWLITFTNGIYKDENNYNSVSSDYTYYDSPYKNISKSGSFSNNKASSTTIKAVRITGSGTDSYAIGVWGNFYTFTNITNSSNNTYSKSLSDFFPDKIRDQNLTSYSESGTTRKNMSAGVEFSFNNINTDYIASIGYHYSKTPKNRNTYSDIAYIDSLTENDNTKTFYSNNREYYATNGNAGGNTDGISLYNYLGYSTGWITPKDNIFISLYGYFCEGDKYFDDQYTYENKYTYMDNAPYTTSFSRTFQNKIKGKDRGVYLTTGYAARLILNDIYLMSGIKLQGALRESRDITGQLNSSTTSTFSEYKLTDRTADFIVPLYIYYSPENWVSIYGGFNFIYRYTYQKYDLATQNRKHQLSSSYIAKDYYTESNNSGWNSSKNIYAGFELKHSSGLRVQTFFTSEFTDLKYWNVSVGYNF